MMKFLLGTVALFATVQYCHACANHAPPQVPQFHIGTVGQGCTPKTITAVSEIVTDPLKCDLPLGGTGCNLCKLRLYKPEKTTSQFLVMPLYDDLSTNHPDHVEATDCKCSDGCYFHKSSITQLGIEPLPNGLTAKGSFSEPFACYSGISSPNVASDPSYLFLIWCESDGGCPNAVVARYSFVIRFELLSPNRPATQSNFIPKITSLPPAKCLARELSSKTKKFIIGDSRSPKKPGKTLKSECKRCKRNNECASNVCARKKCVISRKKKDIARCFPTQTPSPPAANTCGKAKRIASCVQACLA